MRSIEIDFDVHKRIEMERTSFAETPNAVLRRLLGIDDSWLRTEDGVQWSCLSWPYHQQYLGRRRSVIQESVGRCERARSHKKGKLTILDGWMYWTVRRPGDIDWIRLAHLRPRDQPLQQPSSTEPQEEQMPVHDAAKLDRSVPRGLWALKH